MKLRRGCGCPLLILLVVDVVFVAGAILSLVRGPSQTPVNATRLGAGLTLIAMAGNAIACVLLAMAAFRGQALEQSAPETPATEDSSEEEGDAGSGQDDENG